MTPNIQGSSFLIRKKIFQLIGSDFRIYDSSNIEVLFGHQKAFKLKEDITIFTNESKSFPVIQIKARNFIDFSSAYDFYDVVSGEMLGSVRRKGFKSLLKDEWVILNPQTDEQIGLIQEDDVFLALIRRLIFSIIPQKFQVSIEGEVVARYENNLNPFVSKVSVHISNAEKFNPLLAISMGVLLCVVEGKQD